MKKYLFFIFLLVIGSVSGFSLDYSFSDLEYSNGETVQLEVSVDGILEEDLKNDDLEISCSERFVPNLFKIDDSMYYVYFNLEDSSVGECVLSFNDIIYYEEGFLKQSNFETNFSVVEGNYSTIFVDPAGIVFNDFNLQSFIPVNLFNPNDEIINAGISSDLGFVEVVEVVEIDPEEFVGVELYFSEFTYNNEEFGKIFLEFNGNNFEIPIWINVENVDVPIIEDNVTPSIQPEIEVLQGLEGFNLVISKSEDKSGYVLIQNNGINLNLVEFELEGDVMDIIDLQDERLENFNSGDKFREYIYVNQEKNAEIGMYEGNLIIKYLGESIELPISIEVSEVVSNQTVNVNDTVIPSDNESSGINIWIIVLVIFVLLGVVLFLLYKKKTRKSEDFLKNV